LNQTLLLREHKQDLKLIRRNVAELNANAQFQGSLEVERSSDQ
jgi:hypothetical protein